MGNHHTVKKGHWAHSSAEEAKRICPTRQNPDTCNNGNLGHCNWIYKEKRCWLAPGLFRTDRGLDTVNDSELAAILNAVDDNRWDEASRIIERNE